MRNTKVESCPDSARDALLAIIETLKEVVGNTPPDFPITLHAITPFPTVMQTTFAREVCSILHFYTITPSDILYLACVAMVCFVTRDTSLEHDQGYCSRAGSCTFESFQLSVS